MKTFKDKLKDTLSVQRIHNEVEIVTCEVYHATTILVFTAKEARKIGRELIDLANEIEGVK